MKLLKFIKESFMEGVEEGRKELEKEEQAQLEEINLILKNINNLPQEEIFGTSLASPFRTTAFMDWFSLFKSEKESRQEDVIPNHLYTFGDFSSISKDERESLDTQQKESFPITCREDIFEVVQSFLLGLDIQLESLANIEAKYQPFELISFSQGTLLEAWSLSAAASTLISGVEFHDVPKEKALAIFSELLPIIRERFNNWSTFGETFISDDFIISNENKQTAKSTNQTIHNLNFKFGSPWIQYPLEKYNNI